MNAKTLLMTGALALLTLGVADAKSYSVIFGQATKVGTATLKPGEYELSVIGDQAVFKGDGKAIVSVTVKVAQNGKKFGDTTVNTTSKDGVNSIDEIDLGGSATRLQFGQ
jgi:hypothetical protein